MHLSRIKNLLAAPESSVEYYLTASVPSIAANASGVVNTPTLNVVVSRYKKVGAEAAVLTTDGTLRLYTVSGSIRTAFSTQPSASAQTFNFEAGYGQGCTSIQVELTDKDGNQMCSPLSIPVIWKGADAVTYEIQTSVSVIPADANGQVQGGTILAVPYQIVGASRTALLGSPWVVQYSVNNGASWSDCVDIYYSNYNLGPGVPASVVATVTQALYFRLCKVVGGTYQEVYRIAPLQIVRDGAPGERGKTGRFYYYDGPFDNTKEYTSTDKLAPYVAFEWTDTRTVNGTTTLVRVTNYYMLVADSNRSGNTLVAPRTESATGVWELMETNFRYMIAEAFFTNFAKLGSAVFSGDWMISQHGTLNGAASTAYQNFDASDPTGTVAGHFVPNYAIDFLTGRAYLNEAFIRGVLRVKALYTELGGFVQDGQLSYLDLNTSIGNTYVIPESEVQHLPAATNYEGLTLNVLFSPGSILYCNDGIYAAIYTGGNSYPASAQRTDIKGLHDTEGGAVLTIQAINAYGGESGIKWVVIGQRGVLRLRGYHANADEAMQLLPDGRLLIQT